MAAFLVAMSAATSAAASPSAFPETGVAFRIGYDRSAAVGVGGELLLDVPFIDASVGADLALDLSGDFGVRLSGTALVFPTLGTPPLAVGLGADAGWRDDALRAHLGLVAGFDLLFVSRVPGVVSVYLAPGYGNGFSLAWSAEARYYLDAVAITLTSSDLMPIAVGVRVVF